ncbi:MAG: carbamoyltransferase HypF [Fervidicoccaceae archaeon]
MEEEARKIIVIGIVQGVGFRPFIYRLAKRLGLNGYIRNLGGSEVVIHAEGELNRIQELILAIERNHPPRAVIEKIEVEDAELEGWKDFFILPSEERKEEKSVIPPDIGMCDECQREILDPCSRFYRYPFHSCVNCGPRYSMMIKLPYDRENTSMSLFPLCERCRSEYGDPNNARRFYAQGISCPICGPKLSLLDSYGRKIDVEDPIQEAASLINEGHIVAIKGIGGYHIAVLATSSDAVSRLRERKRRMRKPFALMARDIETIEKNAYVGEIEREELLSPWRPIVLLRRKDDSIVSPEVAPGLNTLGFMLPYSPLHFLLMREVRDGIAVMTSANISGEPTCTDLSCLLESLGDSIDYVLDHDRPVFNRVDDSVVKFVDGEKVILRRSRGFAPAWIEVKIDFLRPVIALGAFLNNVGAIAFDNKVVLTQHIGDMDSFSSLQFLLSTINRLSSWYGIQGSPSTVVMDKHPMYPQNRLYRNRIRMEIIEELRVQHHCAHALQATDGDWNDSLLGSTAIAIDGTGYGDDGNIWGGEVLMIEKSGCERVGSLSDFPLIGGDLAVKEAVRPLAGLLFSYFGEDARALLRSFRLMEKEWKGDGEKLIDVLTNGRSVFPSSSSLGRLLDALGCALGLRCYADYDGEIPLMIEDFSLNGKDRDDIGVKIRKQGCERIDLGEVLLKLSEIKEREEARDFLYALQLELGRALGKVASKYSRSGIVLLGGGAAVNSIITRGIREAVSEEGLSLRFGRKVPPGDGGIALGQIIYAGLKQNGVLG